MKIGAPRDAALAQRVPMERLRSRSRVRIASPPKRAATLRPSSSVTSFSRAPEGATQPIAVERPSLWSPPCPGSMTIDGACMTTLDQHRSCHAHARDLHLDRIARACPSDQLQISTSMFELPRSRVLSTRTLQLRIGLL